MLDIEYCRSRNSILTSKRVLSDDVHEWLDASHVFRLCHPKNTMSLAEYSVCVNIERAEIKLEKKPSPNWPNFDNSNAVSGHSSNHSNLEFHSRLRIYNNYNIVRLVISIDLLITRPKHEAIFAAVGSQGEYITNCPPLSRKQYYT